jgi:repressor LexA
MARQIDIASVECDCGHQSHFVEGVIWSMQETSRRSRGREVGLGSSETPEHGIIFSGGSVIAIKCPKLGRVPIEETQGQPHSETAHRLPRETPRYTARQGQFLAFIHLYTKLNRRPPAEADIAQYFRISPPTVHSMVMTLHQHGMISRQPGEARSIRLLIDSAALPPLE